MGLFVVLFWERFFLVGLFGVSLVSVGVDFLWWGSLVIFFGEFLVGCFLRQHDKLGV